MKVLVIDVGTYCGWAYYVGDAAPHIDIGEKWQEKTKFGMWDLNPQRGESAGYRLIHLTKYLSQLNMEIGKPDVVYYEQVERHTGTSAAHVYGALVGHIQFTCDLLKIPYKGIAVQVWKAYSIGNGNAKKDKVLEVMKKLFPAITVQDEADALGILKYVIEKELGQGG